jgi:hypothetical protein
MHAAESVTLFDTIPESDFAHRNLSFLPFVSQFHHSQSTIDDFFETTWLYVGTDCSVYDCVQHNINYQADRMQTLENDKENSPPLVIGSPLIESEITRVQPLDTFRFSIADNLYGTFWAVPSHVYLGESKEQYDALVASTEWKFVYLHDDFLHSGLVSKEAVGASAANFCFYVFAPNTHFHNQYFEKSDGGASHYCKLFIDPLELDTQHDTEVLLVDSFAVYSSIMLELAKYGHCIV